MTNAVVAQLESFARKMSPKFVQGTLEMVGALKQAFMTTEYALGQPYIFRQTVEVAGNRPFQLVIPVQNNGFIDSFQWRVSPVPPVAPGVFAPNCDVTEVSIASQAIFSAIDGEVGSGTVQAGANGPAFGFTSLSPDVIGFKRRIPVALGQVITVRGKNDEAEGGTVARVTFQALMYRLNEQSQNA